MNAVHSAHHDTFHWALQPPKEPGLWHDLEDWLRNGNGLYWISGKAGSGKSTLMKYLYHHRKTRDLLLQWSQWRGEHPLLLADFFFWHLGTPDQKSQEGLSRALLYQVLVQNRRLIPEVLPGMWTEADGTGGSVALPSPAETAQAFRVLASKSSEIQQDFCFFIDGLDEFVGSYTENVSFFKDMVKNHCFKIVISSRPIPECVSAFAELPSLSLQDLTYDDIKGYVQATVGRHKHMQGLLRRYRTEAMELLEDIVRKASGVFLWVILACRSVLHGFADSDRMSELQRRVNELPPELEVMFQHMLGTIDKRHRQQGARLIRMCYEHIQVTERDFNSNSALAMTTLGLALVDDDRFQAEDLSKLENSDKEDFCNDLRGRLRSRTGGLLEVKGQSLVDSNVVFMHRTVYEFLSDDRVWALDCLEVSDSSFHVSGALALLGFYQAMLRLLAVTRTIDNKFKDPDAGHWLRYGLQWAVHPESGGVGKGALFFTHLGHLIKKIINLDDSRVGGTVSDDILAWLKKARSFSLSIRCYHTLMLLATSWSLGLSPENEEDELDLENEEMDSELDSIPVEIPISVHETSAVSKSKRKAEEEAERDLKRRCVHSDEVARVF